MEFLKNLWKTIWNFLMGLFGGGNAAQSRDVGQTYTVQAGDTLSGIAKKFYNDSNKYMIIFEANRNVLQNPDKIQPGQQLRIPKA